MLVVICLAAVIAVLWRWHQRAGWNGHSSARARRRGAFDADTAIAGTVMGLLLGRALASDDEPREADACDDAFVSSDDAGADDWDSAKDTNDELDSLDDWESDDLP